MFTTKNIADLARMNTITASIREAHPDLSIYAVENAVGGRFDPELHDSEIEHWALSQLGRG